MGHINHLRFLRRSLSAKTSAMSQVITNNTLGFNVKLSVPSTVEENDKLAGAVGATLNSAIKNVVYRSWNNIFRDSFSDFLAGATGIARKTEKVLAKDGVTVKKDEEGNEVERYTETANDHVDRVFALLVHDGKAATVEAARAAYDADAQRIADTIAYDPSEKEPAATGPKKISKKWTDAAKEIIEVHQKGDKVAAKLAAYLGHPVEATIDGLARALVEKAKLDAKKEQDALIAD